ncbi:retrotransposon protein, putative, ty1-copia subclass [Tanacetum coccineum]
MKEMENHLEIDDEVVQDQRQRDDNDLQDERQDQPKEEEVEPRRCKRARIEKLFGPVFVSFMVENEPTSYREEKKMKADGTIDKYKARLAIKRFRQQEGLYYFDTYSTRITPIKMILAIAALRNWKVHQMNVKMIFLNGDLEKSDIPGSLLSLAVQLTVSAVVPWETDDESVLREACQTRASAL